MSLESETMKTVLERMYEEAADTFKEYKTNPDYWANNKRKMHGIPMRRKPSKIKTNKIIMLNIIVTFFIIISAI